MLAFAAFADAPVDVVVLEVGMGGEWDSTNVADGQVAVFTPIALDHENRLGSTIDRDRPHEVGHHQARGIRGHGDPAATRRSRCSSEAAELTESTLAVEGGAFAVLDSRVAVGGQLVSIRGLAGEYRDLALPLFGRHQAENAAVAVAAVEAFIGGGAVRSPTRSCRTASPRRARPGACSRSAPTRP